MRDQLATIVNGTVAIRRATYEDIDPLMKAGFPFGQATLRNGMARGLCQTLGLKTRRTGLVAQHIHQKRVVGFLSLFEHTPSICSIKDVFTDPNFRQMGIASGLINHALSLAKDRRAKKVYINPNFKLPHLMKFYESLDFHLIVDTSTIWGGGHPARWQTKDKDVSTPIIANAGKETLLLFNIYRQCMGEKWVNFFETSTENVVNGFSQDFRRFYSKAAVINESTDSFALIFNRPLSRNASIELYLSSDSLPRSFLDSLFKKLSRNGTVYTRVRLFNIDNDECYNLLNEMEFYPYQARVLGRYL
jgi:GNAT superfamily N-acetyltransferase